MGLDAEMKVLPREPLTSDEIRLLGIDLHEAFGDFVWVTPLKQRAIEIVEGERFLRINLISRYYGEGYERGPIYSHIMIAEWLERRLPYCVVFYGSDCADDLFPFGKKEREEIFNHFCKVGHRPYCDNRGSGLNDDGLHADCTFCLIPMRRYGFGADYGSFICSGCSWKQETHDGGKTFTDKAGER